VAGACNDRVAAIAKYDRIPQPSQRHEIVSVAQRNGGASGPAGDRVVTIIPDNDVP
jgi:hypothetical protein